MCKQAQKAAAKAKPHGAGGFRLVLQGGIAEAQFF
jgi:hypothetical protein